MTHIARKRFGQNFLRDGQVIEAIVTIIAPKETDFLVEIGPGRGAITGALLKRIPHLTAIEIDRDLIPGLTETFGNTLTLLEEDALRFDFSTLAPEDQLMRICGNLPYNISTPLLFHLLQFAPVIKDMHFMLQKEVVTRMSATPHTKDYGRLSVMIQYHANVTALFEVPPHAFTPKPKVDSQIVRLLPKTPSLKADNPALFESIVKSAFSLRRKTLANALQDFIAKSEWAGIPVNPTLRPENLSVDDFVRLSNIVHKNNSGDL